jgi:repressor LexA
MGKLAQGRRIYLVRREGVMAEKTVTKREHRDRSDEVLAFINQYHEKNGIAPTEREIMTGVGLRSTSNVDYYRKKLVKAGRLECEKKIARGLRSPAAGSKPSAQNYMIPLLGNIAAGIPILIPGQGASASAAQFEIEVPESYLPGGISIENVFALKVVGDSMRDAMIQDGDTVLVYKTLNIHNGEIVAAWLVKEETTTLKRVRFTGNGVWLEPENPSAAFKPTFYLPEEVDLQGKVLGVLRLYL